jgi:hypothetical protein
MKEITNVTIIIPVHELTEETKGFFTNAVESVKTQTVKPDALAVVIPKDDNELKTFVESLDYDGLKIEVLLNDGETDFASQMNYGAENINTEWFAYLEYDDVLAKTWVSNIVKYKRAHSDVNMFLPIVVNINDKGDFLGLTNEPVWAQQFSDEKGILDQGALLRYENFSINGMAINTEDFLDYGGFKPSIKMTFIYEFLLRATHNSSRIMTIPRIGYQHLNLREGSLFSNIQKSMGMVEADFWKRCAKKEYLWPNDRKITYEQETEA